MDMFTGRVLSREEAEARLGELPAEDLTQKQPEQYRPPSQKDPWSPPPPVIGERINPLTGKPEPRAFPKSYGCDGGVDYGYVFTMRSGTAAFYDKRLESGTIHISGPRSGCTNSVIPACGLLNVPYFYEGCTCSYPLPVGLAMTRMPESYEQWSVWGPGEPQEIQRLGINLGAPGDRMTASGTLWLDWPNVSGPSPKIAVRVEPETTDYFYRHSLWIEGGQGWPWVVASGAKGITGLHVSGLKPGRFTVRLYFGEPDAVKAGERVFDVVLQDQPVITGLDLAARSGGPMRGLVQEFADISSDGTLAIRLSARTGTPVLCGVELVAAPGR
jgi:hypothetical protein